MSVITIAALVATTAWHITSAEGKLKVRNSKSSIARAALAGHGGMGALGALSPSRHTLSKLNLNCTLLNTLSIITVLLD